MALRPEATEPAVDDLKRRARRRLVGAIVLALAAAVVLPLLLESDPKPLGDEVSVRIPPVDNSKFVNPLSPDRGPDAAAPDAKTPRKSITDAERRALGQPVPSTPKPDAVAAAPAPSAPAPKSDGAAKSDAAVKSQTSAPPPAPAPDASPAKADAEAPKAESAKTEPAKTESPKAESAKTEASKPEPAKTEAPKPEPAKTEAQKPEPAKTEAPKADAAKSDTAKTAAPAPAPAKGGLATAKPDAAPGPGAFVVQVGAFADTKAASDLAAQVKSSGFATYTEGVPTTHGTVRRVRVGPFATRAEADVALAKLKAAGYDRALVTPTK